MSSPTCILAVGSALRPQIKIDRSLVLGTGAFGSIYAANWRDDKSDAALAVKVVDHSTLSAKAQAQLKREVELHMSVDNQFLLRCHGAYEADSRTMHLVLDRMVGDVASAIRVTAPSVRTLAPRLLGELLHALHHLHESAGIVHADIKPANLLLDEHAALRLCDLGAACRLQQGAGGRTTLVGSPAYLAPEVVAISHLGLDVSGGASYAHSADVWSSGVCLVEMLTGGGLPFAAEPRDPAAQPSAICFRPPALVPAGAFSARARAVALRLLAKQSYLRPSAREVLEDEGAFEGGAAGEHGYLRHDPAQAESMQAAARACVAALAARGADELEPLFARSAAICSPTPPPPPPPGPISTPVSGGAHGQYGGGGKERGHVADEATTTPMGSSSGGSSGATDDESPMSLPSWTSSLVEQSP